MTDPLATEKAFLRANREKFASLHPGKFLLIKGEHLYGAFDTYDQGVRKGVAQFNIGPFLVRSVVQADDLEEPTIPALSLGVPLVANP